jgi:hypothetical protein
LFSGLWSLVARLTRDERCHLRRAGTDRSRSGQLPGGSRAAYWRQNFPQRPATTRELSLVPPNGNWARRSAKAALGVAGGCFGRTFPRPRASLIFAVQLLRWLPPVRQRSVSTRTITTDRKWYPRGSGAAQTARRNRYAVHSADLHAAPDCLTRSMAQRQHTKRRTRRCAV